MLQGVNERFVGGPHFNSRAQQFSDVENAIRAWRFGGELVELVVIGPKLKSAGRPENFLDQPGDLTSGDEAGIGDVVNAKGGAALPQTKTRAAGFKAIRQRIDVVVQLWITQKLADVIAGTIQMVEGQSQSPYVTAANARDGFFRECFAAAVKAAGRMAETEVRFIGLCKATEEFGRTLGEVLEMRLAEIALEAILDVGAGINAAGRNVTPGNIRGGAGIRDRQRQERIARESFSARCFASIDVCAAGETGGVDEKAGFGFVQKAQEQIETGVVDLLARDGPVGPLTAQQLLLECLPDISRRAEENDHE